MIVAARESLGARLERAPLARDGRDDAVAADVDDVEGVRREKGPRLVRCFVLVVGARGSEGVLVLEEVTLFAELKGLVGLAFGDCST